MKAYEEGRPAYFATPPVNLIQSFHTSLKHITREAPSLEERFSLHKQASLKIKSAAAELGFKQVALDADYAANGMTAVSLFSFINWFGALIWLFQLYFPEGITASDIIPPLAKRGIVVAGGLHAAIKG